MALLLLQNFKITKGMNLDIDILSATSDTAFRLFNIKNLTVDNANLFNLTNEKGNSQIKLIEEGTLSEYYISGTIVGVIQCTLNIAVMFVVGTSGRNYIYRLTYIQEADRDYIKLFVLAKGNFGIPVSAEVSGIFSYENSEIQKVYWVDGVNQLRYINIVNDTTITDVEKLNSNPAFSLGHKLIVERINGGGVFLPGVIQYAFTYYNLHGAETNIVDMTPLYYISEETRGVREDETVGCSFKVTILNPDTTFDYARIYSILRNSLNGTPIVKIVGDIKIT